VKGSRIWRCATWLASLGLIFSLQGCDRLRRADPKACAALAARLCQGSAEASTACRSTLTLLTPDACSLALSKVAASLTKLAKRYEKCDELASKACADLAAASPSCAMLRESPRDLSPEQCASMLREYPQVLAEFRRQDEQSRPLAAELQARLLHGNAPAFGPAQARIKLVEFSDFQCPYCSRAAGTLQAIRTKYGDQIHCVFRQYPLSFHENARLAAEAALAAHAQGKFWELHDKMFANQAELDRASLEAYAQAIGLDLTEFKRALDTEQYKPAVDADLELGDAVVVDGTPTLFINGQRVANPTSVEYVTKLIDSALAKSSGS